MVILNGNFYCIISNSIIYEFSKENRGRAESEERYDAINLFKAKWCDEVLEKKIYRELDSKTYDSYYERIEKYKKDGGMFCWYYIDKYRKSPGFTPWESVGDMRIQINNTDSFDRVADMYLMTFDKIPMSEANFMTSYKRDEKGNIYPKAQIIRQWVDYPPWITYKK